MSNRTLSCLLGVLLFLGAWAQEAKALSLDFLLSSSSVDVGDTVTLSAVIVGLGNFSTPSLGAFDFNIEFDPALVGLAAPPVTFGTLLGDEGLGEAITGSSLSTGSVELFDLSLLTASELNALQPSSFTLASLSFSALASGTNAFTFSSVVLGDAVGDPLAASLGTGSLTINGSSEGGGEGGGTSVPEPASMLLLSAGIAIVSLTKSRVG